MQTELLAFVAVGLVLVTSLTLLLSINWRWSIVALAGQYLGVFLLIWLTWPLEMAVVKLVAGWMAGAVLGITRIEALGVTRHSQRSHNQVFRFLASSLVVLVVFSISPQVLAWIPNVAIAQVWGAALLIGMGLLHLGLTTQQFRVVLALLTVLSGFEIFYAVVESSTLVAGMLAVIHLGLALVGSYFLVSPILEEL